MKDNSKNNNLKKQGEVNSDLSLEQEIIKTLEKKNKQIEGGVEQLYNNVSKGKTSGGFDKWSVSWP